MGVVVDPDLAGNEERNLLRLLEKGSPVLTEQYDLLIEEPFVDMVEDAVCSPIGIWAGPRTALLAIEGNAPSVEAIDKPAQLVQDPAVGERTNPRYWDAFRA